MLGIAVPARAEPRIEAGAFIGLDSFGNRVKLGSDWAAERNTGVLQLFGARLSVLSLASLGGNTEAAFGVEAELAFRPNFTRPMSATIIGGSHNSYFAANLGWRAHAIFRLGDGRLSAHFVLGAGAETVTSSAPFIKTQTEPLVYGGLGLSIGPRDPYRASWDRGRLRVDVRSGYMPAAVRGYTSTIEFQIGLATTFGAFAHRTKPAEVAVEPVVTNVEPPKPPVDLDSDGDGFPDSKDKCPHEAETVNGIDDDDGCPEFDPDHDGIVGAADKCPDEPEDFDKFQDDDGCPDPDNDHDNIADANDKCPNEPETVNGFQDQDGCPDTIPAPVAEALKGLSGVKFDTGRARVIPTNNALMQKSLDLVKAMPDLKLVVVGHPDADNAKSADLAKRRSDAVKWYFVENGIVDTDRIQTKIGDVFEKGPVIEVQLVIVPPPNLNTAPPALGPKQ
ncbi:MAG: OmpA/MotB domain protein [Myxococcales bacterium]|nr:OmpA/MotB domain protein [Myxococcales bacterium]